MVKAIELQCNMIAFTIRYVNGHFSTCFFIMKTRFEKHF